MRNKIFNGVVFFVLFLAMASCETSEDISSTFDHQVPECNSLTFKTGAKTITVSDTIVIQHLWGFVPKANLETVILPTATVERGTTFNISVQLSDNEKLKNVTFTYSPWLFSKYINFSNPDGDIPLTPSTYTFSADVQVPADAEITPWIENYYFKDGLLMKIIQPYHKLELTVVDINMNKRTIAVYIKVE